jgi:hypothetical protein
VTLPGCGRFNTPRLGWVSTGTGGGTGDGAEGLVAEGEEAEGDGGAVIAAASTLGESF